MSHGILVAILYLVLWVIIHLRGGVDSSFSIFIHLIDKCWMSAHSLCMGAWIPPGLLNLLVRFKASCLHHCRYSSAILEVYTKRSIIPPQSLTLARRVNVGGGAMCTVTMDTEHVNIGCNLVEYVKAKSFSIWR